MSNPFSRSRRFAIAFVALALCAILFHNQIAEALVLRGDDYLYRGDTVSALERYNRALHIAPSSQVAADRFVFVSLQRNTRTSLRTAVQVATHYLSARPHDSVLLTDRALCYLHEKRYARAELDFERAARASETPDAYVFAGWAAEHMGRKNAARVLWEKALSVRRNYRPALIALAEHAR
jgi:tetratricopeptide (TPR) repeat protein